MDAFVLVAWSAAAGSLLWALDATWMTANVLLLGVPLAYVLLRAPEVRPMIRWRFVGRFLVFVIVFFNYLCVKYEAWAGPTQFPTVGGANLEQVTWTALIIPLTMSVNEYFFSRQGWEPPSTITRPILIAIIVFGLTVALVPPLQGWLVNYTYIKIGLILYLPIFILAAVMIPGVFREVFLTGLVMAVFNFGYELLALHNGFWTFPGEYVGTVEMFGFAFPTEELAFMVCFGSAGIVATYALYKNWKSMISPFIADPPGGRRNAQRVGAGAAKG